MKVEDGLAGGRADVHLDLVVLEAGLTGGVGDELEHPVGLAGVDLGDVAEGVDVPLRDDEQAAKEESELAILEEFMPAPLTEEELESIVDDAIAENGATSLRDLGRVMADVMPQVAGRADGSAVSQLVREKLA